MAKLRAEEEREVVPEDRATLTSMTDEVERILEAAMQLSDTDRATIAAILKDSIGDGTPREEIEAAWIAEAKRRLEDLRAGRTTTVPWEEVRRELYEMVELAREREASR